MLKTLQRQRHPVAIQALEEVLPPSRQHIDVHGRYRFEAEGQTLNPAAIASQVDIEAVILQCRSVG